MFSVKDKWDSFRKAVIQEKASEIQVSEMQKAYYAGVVSTMGMMHQIGSDIKSEDEGAAICCAIVDEAKQFFNDLKE